MGVTLEGASLPIRTPSESFTTPVLSEGDAEACSLVITASCVPAGRGAATAGGGESESDDRIMGALGMSPRAGSGVMREGECGWGAIMPSEEVSIGDEPPEVEIRASWKAGVVVIMSGIPLAGRRAWRAFQNPSETTVRAGEPPWEAACYASLSVVRLGR
jgi:hypothetical protein